MSGNEGLAGCGDPAIAAQRARELVETVTAGATSDTSFWSAISAQYLAAYLYAAALSGGDMRTVAQWVCGADPQEAEEILTAHQAQQWSSRLSELHSGRTPQTARSAQLVMRAAVGLS